MGHATAHVRFTTEEHDRIKNEKASHYARYSLAERLVSAAVNDWSNDPDGDYGSANAGDALMLPIMPSKVAGRVSEGYIPRQSPVVPIAADKDVTLKSVTVKVPVTAAELTLLRGDNYEARDTLRARAVAAAGGANYLYKADFKLPAARKPRAVATEGKAVTRYTVVARTSQTAKNRGTFDTQSEARAAALRLADEDAAAGRMYSSYEVAAAVVRDSGDEALVRITRPEPEGATVAVTLTAWTVKPNAKPVEYLVSFDYHH